MLGKKKKKNVTVTQESAPIPLHSELWPLPSQRQPLQVIVLKWKKEWTK